MAFANEDQARYYFNSGGQMRFSGSRTGGSGGSLDVAWTNLLNAMGTIKMNAATTTYTGSGGTVTNNVGYFGLTGTYQQIFIHYGSGGYYYYHGIEYDIKVRRENYVGANGGNGSLIRALITFNNNNAGTVNGTLTSQIDQYKATGVLTITSPTWTTVTPL